ncbi:uncharacterized protein LOC125858786 [Solanum stenotomum]|uniref:uncharacterized protein LOC125858786 n=1 Tax=Solanum stenotomum TaxID=172797 RepID=UPI0020D1DE44|nr:uncharacterized protein LOC125858786 [Solanum stenotomum]
MVADPMDEISRFLTSVSDLVEEECRTTMLHDNMNISRLMVYAQQIEESKFKRKNREVKRARTGEGNFSNDKSDGQGRPKFEQSYSGQDPSNTPRFNQEKGSRSPLLKPTCTKCGKNHHGKCLAGMDGCYGCGKSDHQVKHFPTLTAKGRDVKKASLSDLVPIPPNYGCLYALWSREDKRVFPDESIDMLIVPFR